MHKTILIYGENWQGSLPQLLYADLTGRGINTKIFDYTDIMPGIKNRNFIDKVRRRLFYSRYVKRINKQFLKKINTAKPDVVIIAKGLHISLKTLKIIRGTNTQLINWNPDDFFNMKNSSGVLIESLKFYDLIISSRPHLFDKYYSYGAKDLLFVDWYYVPSLHFSQDLEKTIDYSFVGSWSKYREEFITRIERPFVIRGAGWEKSSTGFKKYNDVDSKILTQLQMRRLFNITKVNLNILTTENEDISNLRFFEVPASGGLLLTERNSHSSLYLDDKIDCLMYSSVDEIKDIMDKNLFLSKIAISGTKKIMESEHSFSHRVDKLIRYISYE